MTTENLSVEELLAQMTSERDQAPSEPVILSMTDNIDKITEITTDTEETLENKTVAELLADVKPEKETPAEVKTKEVIQKLDTSAINRINKLIDDGKLLGFEDAKYETFDDLEQLIISNLEHKEESELENLQQKFYQSKSPLWQNVLKYSETLRDPSELLPYLQVVEDINIANTLDLEDEDDCAEIIRALGTIQQLPSEAVEIDIKDLRERGKLKEKANQMKPSLDVFNNNRLQEIERQKQLEESRQFQQLQNHYSLVNEKLVTQKELDGIKIKQEDRLKVANLLVPNEQSGGLPIYSIIDNLLAQGDMETLGMAALYLTDKKSFTNYFNTKAKASAGEDLQRKLRGINTTSQTTVEDVFEQEPITKQNLRKPTTGFSLKF